MADINQVITLGIGTPSGISPFLLLGLSPEGIIYGHVDRRAGVDVFQTVTVGVDVFQTHTAGVDVFVTNAAGIDDVL